MQLELCHEEAVDKADHGAGHQHAQQNHGDRQDLQAGEQLIGGQLQTGRDTGCQTHLTARGNIGTGQNDTAADTQSDGQLGRGQANDVYKRGDAQESGILDGNVNNYQSDDDEHGIVHDPIENGPSPVSGGHGFQGLHFRGLVFFQFGHVGFLLIRTLRQGS